MEKEKLDIVKIEKVIAKGKRFLVYIDIDDEEYKFSENQIVSNRIIKGALFTKEEWDKIINSQNTSTLFDQMLHFIDFKLRTKKEVVNKLKEKKATDEDIKYVIKRLEEIGYIDDERYTNMYIEESIRELKGPYLIKFNLEQKGIESNYIGRILINYSDDVFFENAREVATRYQKTILNHPANKQKELILQKLTRSGYYMDTVNKVLRQIDYPEDSIDKLVDEYEKLISKTNDQNKIVTSLLQKGYRYEDIKKVKATFSK